MLFKNVNNGSKVVFKLNWLKYVDNKGRVVVMTELLLFQTMWQWLAPVNITIVFLAMLGARLVRIRCQVQGLYCSVSLELATFNDCHLLISPAQFSFYNLIILLTPFSTLLVIQVLNTTDPAKMITAISEQCGFGIVQHFISSQFEVSWCNISGPLRWLHLSP